MHNDLVHNMSMTKTGRKKFFLSLKCASYGNALDIVTGTVVMHVGCSVVASPLVPFMILLDESSIVSGVEYPIGTPGGNTRG